MRILIVHNFYQQGGGEDGVVCQEIALLKAAGHDVSIFSVDNQGIRGFFRKICVAVLTPYNPLARRSVLKRIVTFRPDVVHVHNFFPQLSPSIFDACKKTRTPVVLTLHNFRILCPTGFLFHEAELRERSLVHSSVWTVRRRVYRNSIIGTFFVFCMVDLHKWLGTWRTKVDRFIVLTSFAKEKFVGAGLPRERISVKANAAPSNELDDHQERYGALFVGRLSEEKGVAILLEAWQGVNYPLRIAGSGPLREMCENAQTKNIKCLGALTSEQVREEMKRAAFLVLPSVWYEMFPLTIAEAYSAGLPVIASELGGLIEIVDAGVTGLTFRVGDPSALRENVNWAVAHPDKMIEMGSNALADYGRKYTPEVNYANLMNVYTEAIESLRHLD